MRTLLLLAAAFGLVGCAGGGGEQSWLQVPEGQNVEVKLLDTLDTAKAKAGDTFDGELTEDLVAQGKTAVPKGTKVKGRITNVKKAEAAGQTPYLTFQLDSLNYQGHSYVLKTNYFTNSGTPLKTDPSEMPSKTEIGAPIKEAAMNATVLRDSVFRFALAEPLRIRDRS